MYNPYLDIRDRLGEPKWHDKHGVPRYNDFTPDQTDVYDEYAALLEIACQACGQTFQVVVSFHKWTGPKVSLPSAADSGSFDWGDAPWHHDGEPEWHESERHCAGTTMTTELHRIIEFWQKDDRCNWVRHPEYEFTYQVEDDD